MEKEKQKQLDKEREKQVKQEYEERLKLSEKEAMDIIKSTVKERSKFVCTLNIFKAKAAYFAVLIFF